MRKSGIILALLMATACSEKKEASHYGNHFSKLMIETGGHIRGNNIGDPIEKVRAGESAPVTDQSDHYLYYNSTLDENSEYQVSYYFFDGNLFEANMDIYTFSPATADEIYKSFQSYLTDTYGNPDNNETILIWKISEGSDEIEISLLRDAGENDLNVVSYSLLRNTEK